MSPTHRHAYASGEAAALEAYGVKSAGLLNVAAKGTTWAGRLAGATSVPGVSQIAGGVLGGLGGAMEGFANKGNWKEILARTAAGAATGALPLGASLATGVASDYALNKIFAKKPPQQAGGRMPGLIGSHRGYPGMVQ